MTNDEFLSRSFQALAHPHRARIFRLLTENLENGRAYGDLQKVSGLSDRTLVHHLDEMGICGLVARQVVGNRVHYVLTPGPFLRTTRIAQNLLDQEVA